MASEWRDLSRAFSPAAHPAVAEPEIALRDRVRRAVLIADDDPPLLNLLRTLVGRDPRVDVVACRDGEEAILALSARHFDIVLLDLMMPRRSGFDVIDFLREHRPAQLRLVVVLTAATRDLTGRLDPAVVHAVIEKPFETSEILEIVRDVLDAAEAAGV